MAAEMNTSAGSLCRLQVKYQKPLPMRNEAHPSRRLTTADFPKGDGCSWPVIPSTLDCRRERAAGRQDCAERNWPCSQALVQPGTPGWNKDERLPSQGKCSKAWPASYSWMPMNEPISSFSPASNCLLTHCP